MSIRRRLEALEDRVPAPEPPNRIEVRARMKEHLDRLAAYRCGNMPEEEREEFEAVHASVMRRLEEIRGEGGR